MTVANVGLLSFLAGLLIGIFLMYRAPPKPRMTSIEARRAPLPGELWTLSLSKGGPWETENKYKPVTILAVSDGWVRYAIGSVFPDERQTVDSFTRMYRKTPNV